MNPLEFYCLILKNMDKNLAKKLGKIEKKYTNVPFENDEIAKVKIKSKFASEMGFFVLNSATSLAVDEENYNFAYCLKILELYPIKNNDFFYWNEHIKLFSELEKIDSLEKMQVFRIYRDVRFSKDKLPYKNHFSVGFSICAVILF